MNFNKNKIEVAIHELVNMLKSAQNTMVKEKTILVATAGPSSSKKKGKKGKGKVPKGKKVIAKKPKTDQKKDKCFHCSEAGHWKRNYKAYISTLAKNGMHFLKVANFSIDIASWVFDTGCGAHLCNNLQVLQGSKRLRPKEMVFRLEKLIASRR